MKLIMATNSIFSAIGELLRETGNLPGLDAHPEFAAKKTAILTSFQFIYQQLHSKGRLPFSDEKSNEAFTIIKVLHSYKWRVGYMNHMVMLKIFESETYRRARDIIGLVGITEQAFNRYVKHQLLHNKDLFNIDQTTSTAERLLLERYEK